MMYSIHPFILRVIDATVVEPKFAEAIISGHSSVLTTDPFSTLSATIRSRLAPLKSSVLRSISFAATPWRVLVIRNIAKNQTVSLVLDS